MEVCEMRMKPMTAREGDAWGALEEEARWWRRAVT